MVHRCKGTLKCPGVGNSASLWIALPLPLFSSLSYTPLFPSFTKSWSPHHIKTRLWLLVYLSGRCLPAYSLIFCHVSCPHPPHPGSPICPLSSVQGQTMAVGAQACCDAQKGGQTPRNQAGARPLQANVYRGIPASQCLVASNTSTRPDLGKETDFHRDIARQTGYVFVWFLLHSTVLLALCT